MFRQKEQPVQSCEQGEDLAPLREEPGGQCGLHRGRQREREGNKPRG